ncbi:class I SAM-dependent methyltransferase [Solibacillus sp. FSL H8-0538]|uniref:class I SAM-dependent methyltransferase n=1 Tax=Solibacillus sp. FSL H8-0538 TaxID=2921400 RepID=UPI0030FA1F52
MSWNAGLYDEKHQFVSKYGESLVEVLAPLPGEKILDVGCGTGDLASEIGKLGATVYGIDASASMIEQAKQKYPTIDFSVQDASTFRIDLSFDAAFSNATLHWIKAPDAVAQSIFDALKNGGRFVGELGGAGNIVGITTAIKESLLELGFDYNETTFPWYFPTEAEYQNVLEQAGFTVEEIMLYERPTPLIGKDGLRNWLKMFSEQFFNGLTEQEKEQVYDRCEEKSRAVLHDGEQWIADYWRLRFIAKKS